MTNEPQAPHQSRWRALEELDQLRQFAGVPKDFWPRFLAAVMQLALADKVVLVVRASGQSGPWRRLLDWPADTPPSQMLTAFLARLDEVAAECLGQEAIVVPLAPKDGAAAGNFILASRLALQRAQPEECVMICLLSEAGESEAREALVRLRLAAWTPEFYQMNLAIRQAKADVEKFASALDLSVVVSAEKRFLAAALAFCNTLATRHNCERVSLGWLERGYVRLQTISRTEKFDRQMAVAQALEVTMEEAIDQDDEILWPPPEGSSVVTRDHEKYAKGQEVGHICSLPLRVDHKPVAVITAERRSGPFSPLEVQQLRLACDLAATRLADLKQQDCWVGARWAAATRQRAAKLIGPEHTWAKLLAVGVTAALVVLFFVPVPYRVEGNFVLHSEKMEHLTAPFDGYIDQVFARPGDRVTAGSKLVSLKTSELELEAASAVAEVNRYQREAEKARAAKALADMRVDQALAQEAQARLDVLRYEIAEATIKAPFDGVVVEGDLRDRLGTPVKRADVLMRVARIDTLYPEAEVNERDIHEILGRTTGQMAFLSQPQNKYPLRITTVEQAALPKNQENVFLVRCAVDGGPQSWWRPGMSGLCKFDAGRRTLFWILTHRTVDFLRMKLWW